LIEYPSSDLLLNALLADRVDIGYELGTDVIFNALVKASTVLKIYQVSLSYKEAPSDFILVPIDSELKTLTDLKGKKLGLFPGPTAKAFAESTLRKAYLEPSKDVLLTSLPPSLQLDALASKQIDALFTYEPVASRGIVEKKAKILQAAPVEESIINPWPGGVGVITKYCLNRNPRAVRQVVEAIYQTFSALEKNPSTAQAVLTKRFNLSPDAAKRIHLTKHWITFPTPVAGDIKQVDRAHMEKLMQFFCSQNIIPHSFEPSAVYFAPKD